MAYKAELGPGCEEGATEDWTYLNIVHILLTNLCTEPVSFHLLFMTTLQGYTDSVYI